MVQLDYQLFAPFSYGSELRKKIRFDQLDLLSKKKVRAVHECWQIDAKENLCLLDGSKACYLTMVDKKSGAVLTTPCFNKGKINQVSEVTIRDELIKTFHTWGKPQSVRLDNGRPLGDPQRKSFPTLGLWLTALGIEVIYNRPRRPTDNASV